MPTNLKNTHISETLPEKGQSSNLDPSFFRIFRLRGFPVSLGLFLRCNTRYPLLRLDKSFNGWHF